MTLSLPPGDLLKAVKEHALANYSSDGWDVIVEAWTDEEILAELKHVRSAKGAIERFRKIANLWNEQRQNAQDW